jgi:hypothetical protein
MNFDRESTSELKLWLLQDEQLRLRNEEEHLKGSLHKFFAAAISPPGSKRSKPLRRPMGQR